MFKLLKFLIWLVGLAVATYFVLSYFGYEPNMNYFKESKAKCQEKLTNCQKELIHQGIDNAKCDFDCVDPKLIIKKK
jgi:F0F1-type ATP synthase membrane subunit b/b'